MRLRRPPPRRLVDLLIVCGVVVTACSGPAADVIASEDQVEPTTVAAVDSTGAPTSSSVPTTVPVVTVEGADGVEPSSTSASTPSSVEPTTTSSTEETRTTPSSATSSTVPPTSAADDDDVAGAAIPIRIRLDRRVSDAATEGFEELVRTVLTDERGWKRAGFEISFTETDPDDPAGSNGGYTVVLAEGDEVDSLCLPYDTFGRFSCQIGPVVALNADRWRTAVESWPASLDEYRTMLVNHEVGHLLGQHHPAVRCPGDGQPAPVMAQQSSGVAPCTANPWPLDWEIVCARQGVEPLAPGFERNIQLTCGPDGPIN